MTEGPLGNPSARHDADDPHDQPADDDLDYIDETVAGFSDSYIEMRLGATVAKVRPNSNVSEKTTGPTDEVAAVELMTRALVGITLHSLEVLGGQVTLPQFNVLLIASGLGTAPTSKIAATAMMPASSVTRLADKLAAAGLLERGTDPRSRSIVTLKVTDAGLDLVSRVVARRHELLGSVLDRMEPADRQATARIARQFAGLAADAEASSVIGPLPL